MNPSKTGELVKLARMLIYRLERLSVDSHWAHRASGIRRSLMRAADEVEEEASAENVGRLERLMKVGFELLEKGAREVGPRE